MSFRLNQLLRTSPQAQYGTIAEIPNIPGSSYLSEHFTEERNGELIPDTTEFANAQMGVYLGVNNDEFHVVAYRPNPEVLTTILAKYCKVTEGSGNNLRFVLFGVKLGDMSPTEREYADTILTRRLAA